MTEPVAKEKPKPRPLKKLESRCVDVVKNTPDTFTLLLDTGAHPEYDAGQFISIDPKQFPELSRQIAFLEHLKGKKEQHRAYSMSSAPAERYVSITVKAEGYDAKHDKYPPLLSPFLASPGMKGRIVNFVGYTGAYTLDVDHAQQTKQVLHLVAGSGIVPNYALLKDELLNKKNTDVKHTMVYVNKTVADVIFEAELERLAHEFPDRFELFHCLTREEVGDQRAHWRTGRPTLEWVRSLIQDPETVHVFACGAAITKHQRHAAQEAGVEATPRFMEGVERIMHTLEIGKPRFKSEEFG
ncbi:MAG: oxidoreductase [Deltaproteobacteria bacterium]|nr:oxidoreductase [Deltaproteobacteria bacterium]